MKHRKPRRTAVIVAYPVAGAIIALQKLVWAAAWASAAYSLAHYILTNTHWGK